MMIPALDLIEGRVVRLYQGDFSQQTTFDIDAVEQAQSYQAAGAQWLHLVDLDGAKNPQNRQLETLRTICAATNLNCQAGGGIRSTEDIEEILACGIKRVVIGSKPLPIRNRSRLGLNNLALKKSCSHLMSTLTRMALRVLRLMVGSHPVT